MQRHTTIASKQLPFKRVYGVMALILLIAFAGRISLICINGGTGLIKSQQVLTEGSQEQNDSQEESKLNNEQLAEFIWPAHAEMPNLPVAAYVVGYPVYLSLCVKVPLIAVITPPPDLFFA